MMHRRFVWVCMYISPQRLCSTILCYRMYFQHACRIIAQFSGRNVSPGMITVWTAAWPVWPVFYGRTQLQAFQVPAPLTAHRVRYFEDTP